MLLRMVYIAFCKNVVSIPLTVAKRRSSSHAETVSLTACRGFFPFQICIHNHIFSATVANMPRHVPNPKEKFERNFHEKHVTLLKLISIQIQILFRNCDLRRLGRVNVIICVTNVAPCSTYTDCSRFFPWQS